MKREGANSDMNAQEKVGAVMIIEVSQALRTGAGDGVRDYAVTDLLVLVGRSVNQSVRGRVAAGVKRAWEFWE